jgi:hypothetical protein
LCIWNNASLLLKQLKTHEMKKLMHQFTKLSLNIIFWTFTISANGQSNCKKVDFSKLGEVPINLNAYIKKNSAVKYEAEMFKARIKLTDAIMAFDSLPFQLPMWAIKKLLDTLVRNSTTKLSGVKIFFGLDKQQTVLFFQPVTMSKLSRKWYRVNSDLVNLYQFENNELSKVIMESFKERTEDYLRNVRIDRLGNSNFEKHNLDSNVWYSDTKAIIFTFQELFEWYHQVKPEDTCYSGTIYFYNGANKFKRFGTLTPYHTKHTLFVTDEKLDSIGIKNTRSLFVKGEKDAANLGHLCPPSCDRLYYKLKD